MVKIKVHRARQEEEKVFLNPQAQKDADAAETEALKNQLTKFLKELGRYTVWVLSITMITMVTRNSIVSHFTNQVVKNLIEKSLLSAKAGNIVSLWSALSGLSKTLLTSQFLFGDPSFATVYTKNYDLFGNIRVGGITLRQVRVKTTTCPTLLAGGASSSCSPDFTYFDEATGFEKPWEDVWLPPAKRASEFEFKSAQLLEEWFAFPGKNAVYPGNGFVAKFSSLGEATEVLADLQSLDWIDPLTRALFFDAVTYCPNTDVFIQTKILFEIYPSGQFESTVYNRVIDLNFYPANPTFLNLINIGLQVIVVGLLGYYTKEEATAIYIEGPRLYFSQVWNTFDVFNILLLIILCIMRINLVSQTTAVFANMPEASPSKIGSIMILADNENVLMGIVSVLMWFKMLKYFSTYKPLGKLGRAISNVGADIIANSIIMICCMFGWAVGQTMVAGMDVERFSTISTAMTSHFCSLFGGYYADVYDDLTKKSQAGTLLFWSWYLFSQLILLNIFVAIFQYGLVLVMYDDAQNKKRGIFSVVKELDVVKKVMTAIQTQEEALAEMEAALEMVDENDDGLIDEVELKAFLNSNKEATAMFDVQDEKEMMKMFDQDGSGKLDVEEMGNSNSTRITAINVSHSGIQASFENFWATKREN
jgi:predicted RNase H-like HicB family nuclease